MVPGSILNGPPMRRLTSAWLLAALMSGAALSAQNAQTAPAPLTMDAALDLAMAQNKTIAAARRQQAVDQAGVGVAGERPNPDFLYESSKDTPKQAVSLTLPIELGGKRGARISVAKAAVATGEAQVAQVIASVRDDVRRTYIELAAAERRVTLEQEVVGLFSQARDAASQRVQAGDAPRRDEVAAQADLAFAQNDVTAAQGDAAAARARLNVLLGRPANTPIALADALDLRPVPSLESALARANQTNADLAVLDREMSEQQARVALAHALQKPDVAVGGGATFNAQPDFSTGWRFNVGFTVPLFTTHHAGVLVEDATLVRLHGERDATVDEIAGGVASALAQASSAATRLTNFNDSVLPLSLQDETFAQDAYRSGQTSLAELILSLEHAHDRRLGALQAALDFHLALADLERAIAGPLK